MRNAFIRTITQLGSDPRTMLLIADTGEYIMRDFKTQFPTQFINTGIAEQNMIGVAAGLALSGHIPFTYSIGAFYTRAYDQIRVDLCQHNLNIKLVSVGSGLSYGTMGATHHSIEDIAMLRALPNMTILSPCDPEEAAQLTDFAFHLRGPVYLRLALAGESPLHDNPSVMVLGGNYQATTLGRINLLREGHHATIIATGRIVEEALSAANILKTKSVFCTVLNAHTLKPFDSIGVRTYARRTGIVVTVEEHNILGGLGTMVAEAIFGDSIKMIRLGVRDQFCPIYGDKQYIYNAMKISAKYIAESVETLLYE